MDKRVRKRIYRTMCSGVLSLALILPLTVHAEEAPPGDSVKNEADTVAPGDKADETFLQEMDGQVLTEAVQETEMTGETGGQSSDNEPETNKPVSSDRTQETDSQDSPDTDQAALTDETQKTESQIPPDLIQEAENQDLSSVTQEGEQNLSGAGQEAEPSKLPENAERTDEAAAPETAQQNDPEEELSENDSSAVVTRVDDPETETGAESAVPDSRSELRVPSGPTKCESNFGSDFKLVFEDSDWLEAVTGITVAGEAYTPGSSSFSVWENTCYYIGDDYSGGRYLLIGEGGRFENDRAVCVICAEGYADLTLELDRNNHSAAVTDSGSGSAPEPSVPEVKPAPGVAVDTSDSWYLQLAVDDEAYVSGITAVSVNDRMCKEQSIKMALNGDQYYLDKENSRIVFDNFSKCPIRSGDILTVVNPAYGDLKLKFTIAGSEITVSPADDDTQQGDEYQLHIRLVGSFEAALTDQKGYDAVSGASTNITQNKNSNVSVEAVLTKKEESPSEDAWQPLADSDIRIDAQKTVVNLDSESGMIGVYSPYDSSLTLAGIPKTPGEYPVSVTVTDEQGRTADSNELMFRVYSGEEYLEDRLTLNNCVQTEDGRYMYDMEPWAIKNFCAGESQTVTVPAGIKAWYGSHTSGTYGELGYPIPFGSNTVQTLLIPEGCDLTLVNMNILSSVRIVVQSGGKLTLRDTPVQGIIEVQGGGTFSMNYDSYGQEFLMGASVNGQLILQNGAVVDHAIIYSNTNYIANGTQARRNEEPVVVVNGNIIMQGQVLIRGDEAPTGGAGQPGLKVNHGTVTVPDGSVLAVYGGGYSALTHDGGDAVILDQGTITGGGKLIALGGYSADVMGNGTGGDAVSGTGSISVSGAYLKGGNVYQGVVGRPLTDQVTLAGGTDRNLTDGRTGSFDYDHDNYWHGATLDSIPDLDQAYPIEKNAPGETDPDQPGTERPDVPDGTNPDQPGAEKPDGTDPDQPGTEKPDGTDSDQPGTEKPNVPDETNPDQADTEKPDVPDGTNPDQPGAENPDIPDGTDSDQPGTEKPDVPDETNPDQADTEKPDISGTVKPNTPASSGSNVTDTSPESKDPDATKPTDSKENVSDKNGTSQNGNGGSGGSRYRSRRSAEDNLSRNIVSAAMPVRQTTSSGTTVLADSAVLKSTVPAEDQNDSVLTAEEEELISSEEPDALEEQPAEEDSASIPDEEVPLAGVEKSFGHLWVWIMILLALAGAGVMLLAYRRKVEK